MTRFTQFSAIAVAVFSLSGCYHATVETGLPPSPQTLERAWAHGWLFGLVPPSTTETQQRCPTGVARVETQLSFVNQLAYIVTTGIYSPMSIVVTCAASSAQGAVGPTIENLARLEAERAADQ
jgi:hypothetical protein